MSETVQGLNPAILIWARERSGQSVADVAAQMKKDPEAIAAWEDGSEAPTYLQLETLAYKVFKRPLALFFFPEPPPEVDPEQAFRTLPEAEIDSLQPDTRLKVRAARAMQMGLSELTEGQNPASQMILRDVTVNGHSAANVASAVRRYLDVTLEAQRAWKDTEHALKVWRSRVEDAGVFVFKDSFKQRDISGFSLYDPKFPLVMINNSTSQTRQIFTLFHELGHLLVHESGVTKQDDRFIQRLTGDSKRVEVFCNQFAAEVLVPSEALKKAISGSPNDEAIAALANAFKVSREVILRRFMDMGLVSQRRYEEKAAKWAEDYEASRGAKPGGNYYLTRATYLSDRYAKLAFSKYYQGTITLESLAGYLNVKVKSVAGLEHAILQKASHL
jgi:Zn-dependent peptidase ImmA (M78 family)